MKRKIRFKAKRLDNGEWVEGYYYKECSNSYIIEDKESKNQYNDHVTIPVDPPTACQFTGLKDKNGREVWEHDIIQSPCLKARCEVKWNEFICCISPNGMFVSLGEIINNQGWTVVCSKFDRKEEK